MKIPTDFEAMNINCPACAKPKAHMMKAQRYNSNDNGSPIKRVLFKTNALVCSACGRVTHYRAGSNLRSNAILNVTVLAKADTSLTQLYFENYITRDEVRRMQDCLEFGEVRRDL